jgi:outer membrane protein OmpA-like peptidoglycan-associated protein
MPRVLLLRVLLLLLAPRAAHAQDAQGKTYNLQLFRPAIDSKGYFTVNASQPLGHLDFSFGLVGTYAREPLVLRGDANSAAGGSAALFRVSDFVTAQLHGAIGLYNRAELALTLPVHILFGNRGPSYVSSANHNFDSDLTFGAQMIGDLGLHAKVRILRRPIGLALLASVYAPTGPSDKFLGDGNFTLHPALILDREFRRVRLALNVGVLARLDRNTFTDRGTTLNVPGSGVDPSANNGAPFCFPAPTLTQPAMTCGTGRSRTVGTQLTYGLGVSAAVVPQKLDVLAELYGYADVTGARDAFPLEWLAGAKVYLASKSYFEIGAGTGVVPGQTGSPLARAFVGFTFEPAIGDRDHDGVKDDVDACPDDPEDRDDFEDEDGCPDPDNDHDHILDVDDKCPNDPETVNGYRDDDGCPDVPPVRVRRRALEIGTVYFETNKAVIKPISFPLLDELGAALKNFPQIRLVEIQGHADERGDDDYNMWLTEQRAQAVRTYLIERGHVEAARLDAHGYGETLPICTEHNEACWSKNRRVEFIIVKQEGDIPGQTPD